MEYIKKEDLIIGTIYKSTHYNNLFKYLDKDGSYNPYLTIKGKILFKFGATVGQGLQNIIMATNEEKHWLETCIKLDKFITFEEAMKTFIPEYVECTASSNNSFTENKVYKIEKWNNNSRFNLINDDYSNRIVITNGILWSFKPSTKEAYDAQFIVKDPEFVLPEKWCLKITKENLDFCKSLSKNELHFNKDYNYTINGYYSSISNKNCYGFCNIPNNYIEITLEQFKKYILKEETFIEFGNKIDKIITEPSPQFKVIETIETITKVENNEGNQFFIGDVVKSSNGTIQTIESFDYNKSKTNIIAFTNKQSILGNGIGIDKIEHYVEPKTDYKILEYKTEGGISCKAPFLADSHQFYINERCKIYSIKRISDDLIITVGDEVLSKTCGVPNKILSIELINNKIRLYPRNSFYNLEDIIKVKEETLLEKAKRLYPVGTKVNSLGGCVNQIIDNNTPFINDSGGVRFTKNCLVYLNGKWADIIK